MMALLITAIFIPAEPQAVVTPSLTFGSQVHSFWLCFLPVFFTYGGYQQTMNFGSDVQNATRTMPRAIFFGIAIILVLYLLLNYSYYHVLGIEGIRNSTALASDMAAHIFGPYASRAVAVVMFLSVMAYVNASIMSNPRVYFAMAEDKVLPRVFARINERTQVLGFSTTFFVTFMVLTLFLTSSFSKVLDYVMFFDSISIIAAAAAIFILRYRAKQQGEKPDVYKIPFYPWLPAIFVVTYTLVNISIIYRNPYGSLIALGLFLTGWPLFFALKKLISK
jgi:basic amino acid/polyamine antiporter, APA family